MSLKKLFVLSCLPAVFLISCAVSTMTKNGGVAGDVKATRDLASQKFRFLTVAQIKKMPAKKVYNYYMKLYAMMNEMERFQVQSKNPAPRKKTAQFFRLMESSFGGTESLPPYAVGNDCLIGGYWGKWVKKPVTTSDGNTTYRVTCDSDNHCTVPGYPTANTGHKCNPKFFTYMDADAGQEFCVDLKKDLTTNACRSTIEDFYKKAGSDSYADHFRRSMLKAIATDAKYQGISQDAAIQRYQQEVYTEYERIYNYCGPTEEDWNRHSAGQNYSCFPLMKQYAEIQTALNDMETTTTDDTAEVDTSSTEDTTRLPAGGNGLGPYACIASGLKRTGHPGISHKYIAMLAMMAKYRNDMGPKTTDKSVKTRVNRAIITTISTMTDIGLCKANYKGGSYEFSNGEASQSESWLSESKFNRQSFAPGDYESLFGIPWNAAMPLDKNWESMTPSKRKASWNAHAPNEPHTCVKNSNDKIKAEDCETLFRTCKLEPVGCREERKGGNKGGNDNGTTTSHGDTTTHPGDDTTSPGDDNGTTSEVGSGSNAESGHGGDGSSDMGSGPPGN